MTKVVVWNLFEEFPFTHRKQGCKLVSSIMVMRWSALPQPTTRTIRHTKIRIFNWSVANALIKINAMPIIFDACIHFHAVVVFACWIRSSTPPTQLVRPQTERTKRMYSSIRINTLLFQRSLFHGAYSSSSIIQTVSVFPHSNRKQLQRKKTR